MTYIPTPIYIPTNSEPSRCPKCKRLENIKEVCAECGYEYPEEDFGGVSWYFIIIFVLVVAFLLWLTCTIVQWLYLDCTDVWDFNDPSNGDCTLIGVLKSQWEWLKELFRRIW